MAGITVCILGLQTLPKAPEAEALVHEGHDAIGSALGIEKLRHVRLQIVKRMGGLSLVHNLTQGRNMTCRILA